MVFENCKTACTLALEPAYRQFYFLGRAVLVLTINSGVTVKITYVMDLNENEKSGNRNVDG